MVIPPDGTAANPILGLVSIGATGLTVGLGELGPVDTGLGTVKLLTVGLDIS